MYHSLLTSKSSCPSSHFPSFPILTLFWLRLPTLFLGTGGWTVSPAQEERPLQVHKRPPASMLWLQNLRVSPGDPYNFFFLHHQDNLPQIIMPLNFALTLNALTLKPLSHPFLTLPFLILPGSSSTEPFEIISKMSTAFISSLNFSEPL